MTLSFHLSVFVHLYICASEVHCYASRCQQATVFMSELYSYNWATTDFCLVKLQP